MRRLNRLYVIMTLLLIGIVVSHCSKKPTEPDIEYGTMTDQDGNIYKTVAIGDQVWMAENLKVTHYRNGDAIPNVTDQSEWAELSVGAFCAFNNDESNAEIYGYLYNWYATNDSRAIAPADWHMPTDEEWKELEMFLGMSQAEADSGTGWRGLDEGEKLKESGRTHWNYPNFASNESGFTALPGCSRHASGEFFFPLGDFALFWSATENDSDEAWYRFLMNNAVDVDRRTQSKRAGLSVRLVQN
jgi:uncharacterized protein (TIGR02145 family)